MAVTSQELLVPLNGSRGNQPDGAIDELEGAILLLLGGGLIHEARSTGVKYECIFLVPGAFVLYGDRIVLVSDSGVGVVPDGGPVPLMTCVDANARSVQVDVVLGVGTIVTPGGSGRSNEDPIGVVCLGGKGVKDGGRRGSNEGLAMRATRMAHDHRGEIRRGGVLSESRMDNRTRGGGVVEEGSVALLGDSRGKVDSARG